MAAEPEFNAPPTELVEAAARLLESARALAAEQDPELWPGSAVAARRLLRSTAALYRDVNP